MIIFTAWTDRTLESFSLSANKLREHLNGQDVGHNGSIHDNNTNSNGHANGLENDNTTKDDLSTSELADVCERMGVARDAIVKIAPVTPTQGEHPLFWVIAMSKRSLLTSSFLPPCVLSQNGYLSSPYKAA